MKKQPIKTRTNDSILIAVIWNSIFSVKYQEMHENYFNYLQCMQIKKSG